MVEEVAQPRVALRLRAGEIDGPLFQDVMVYDLSSNLREFLEAALKDLESQSLIQLPETDNDDIIDPRTFKVFDEGMTRELELDLPLCDHPYIVSGLTRGANPSLLVLQSDIFMSASQVAVEGLLKLRKKKTEEPQVPQRKASLETDVMSKEEIVYLAGRKDPVLKKMKRDASSGSLASVSHDGSGDGSPGLREMAERVLFDSASGDSSSLQSVGSTSVANATTSAGSTPNDEGGVVTRNQSRKKKISRRRPVSRVPSLPLEGSEVVAEGDRTSKSVPNTPDSVGMELGLRDGMESECGGLHSPGSRFKGTEKVRLSGSCSLPLIEEPAGETEEEEKMTAAEDGEGERLKFERSPSPSLMVPPSPVRQPSPNTSPRNTRKTRIATRRRGSRYVDGGGRESEGLERQPSGETFTIVRKRTLRDTSRRSAIISSYFPSKIFTTIQTFPITFDFPIADLAVEMVIQGDQTVGQIKDDLWSLLREKGMGEDDGTLTDPEKFTFTYRLRDDPYELYDEQQIFQTAAVVQIWRRERAERGFLTVELKKVETKEEKTLNMEIGAMIGIGLYQLQFANNDELDITRRKMVAVRRYAVRSRDAVQYSMETDTTFQDIPENIKSQLVEDRVLLRVYYKAGSYMTYQVEVYEIADNLVPQFVPDSPAKRARLGLPEEMVMDDYVLKVAGEESYIYGHYELIKFSYILRCISKRADIVLALVRKNDTEEDRCRDVADWNLIDSSTGLTGTHSELSALSKDHTQVFTMSMWDLHRKFRARIVGLDNFHHPDIDVVYIEAGVYHGGELLGGLKFTTESVSSAHPRWHQWLTFDIPVRMLPKAARLCLQVVGGVRSRDSRKRSSIKNFARSISKGSEEKKSEQHDQPFHWVNMQILDHRALLRQGLLRLNLWPVTVGDGTTSSTPSPMGSTAVNPDGNTSVALYIELDTYMHPVACPTGGWGEERSSQPETTPRREMKAELDAIILADPLITLTKPQRELVWTCRSYCSRVPEALPKLLRSINWADLAQVSEVHRLLEVWEPITLEVALELLDYHFADERVRTLAVHRLEKLSNEELMLFLLQLTQVLKFEPYHDSALARLLLKRALLSKKIGHFFYWYLRSEMDTPEFSQRFGILLEAYLRGCGESMFKELQSQHKAVCDIMSVASRLKKNMEKGKSVVEFARAELAKYQLPEAFSPPFNPIVKMGNLNLAKCKVMDSKKSPLWLEFESKDPTAVGGRLIKVIAKHGDDLRQDMLTLQMLSLMDKLWQAEGLDLYIIPYGCIATGNMMGMIEVVQEADTVAKIQQQHGGSFSAFKEEPLHDWLRGFNQTKNRWDSTVERFMLSCAGYCVATYILGIGDRHNDNIMVTTSGNLFHIDFGHFLGNQKKFMGVNRERAPFVLTPDFEYVMGKRGSDVFRRFEETALEAYLVIRRKANLFINLFSMMKCTGIPELRSVEDIEYLRGVLFLGRSEEEAKEHFKSQIQSCLKLAWRTQLNFLVHNYAHSRS